MELDSAGIWIAASAALPSCITVWVKATEDIWNNALVFHDVYIDESQNRPAILRKDLS